jgi:hypothetical protein
VHSYHHNNTQKVAQAMAKVARSISFPREKEAILPLFFHFYLFSYKQISVYNFEVYADRVKKKTIASYTELLLT